MIFHFAAFVGNLNAMALPISDVRDPIEISNEGGEVEYHYIKDSSRYKLDLLLLGVAVACMMMMACTCMVHQRLKAEHAALAKDKHVDGSLYKFWNKVHFNPHFHFIFFFTQKLNFNVLIL